MTDLCRSLGVSRSSYYEYESGCNDEGFVSKIELAVIKAFWRHKRRYGTRRLVSELADEGIQIGRKRISSILRKNGLRAIQPKSYVPKTTQTNPYVRRSPNLLLDRAKVSCCNEVWVGDITYLPLHAGGWLYMSAWLDMYSHNIVGWDIQEHMEASLIKHAFEKAVLKRNPDKGMIVHSDGGSQYSSNGFRKQLNDLEYLQSMTRRDNHYDNAMAESLFSRFKAELLEGGAFMNKEEAIMESFEYIELYYNPIRRHSTIGNKSPLQFEKEQGY